MEVMNDAVATEKRSPETIGGMRSLGRFVVLGLLLAVPGDATHTAKNPPRAEARADVADDQGEFDPSSLERGEEAELIGKSIRIVRDGRPDAVVSIRRRRGEVELSMNGNAYRIRDAMNVNVGGAIVSATLRDGIVTIATTEHGTAKVRWSEAERIALMLDGRPDASMAVSTVFEPQGAALCGAIALRRWYNGHTPGDEETYDLAFDRVDDGRDELALARD